MSEDNNFSEEAAVWNTDLLSEAAQIVFNYTQIVFNYKSCLIMVSGQLTELEIYGVLSHPAENAAALDQYIKSSAAPEEDELRKYQAVAYLLQKLAYARAALLEKRRKEYKIKAVV